MSDRAIHLEERGYIISPVLENLDAPLWRQRRRGIESYLGKDGEDIEDEEDDVTGWELESAWKDAEERQRMGIFHTKRTHLKYRMWSLACLQRTGAVSIMGFYPMDLIHSDTDGKKAISTCLEAGGHQMVIEKLNSIDGIELKTEEKQNRLAVIRFNQPMTSWDSVVNALKQGHDELKERHKLGNEELYNFIKKVKSGDCLRRAFSPAIGADDNVGGRCGELLKSGGTTRTKITAPRFLVPTALRSWNWTTHFKNHYPSMDRRK